MSISIRTNVGSLTAQRNLDSTQTDLRSALDHLSSGYRISTAADDAAGLAISENLRSQVRGSNQAARNAQDGISMVQTAEGGMNEQASMLQRMRELAVQGANDTLSGTSRSAINAELVQLTAEFNGVSARTRFNGQSLLTGAFSTQVGVGSSASVGAVTATGGNATVSSVDVSGAKAGDTYTMSSAAAGTLTMTRASDNVAQTINVAAIAANGSASLNFSQLGVNIGLSTDGGGKTAAGIVADFGTAPKTVITAAASSGSAAQLQLGANSSDAISVTFKKVSIDSTTAGYTALNTALAAFATASATNSATATDANNLLNSVDAAIAQLGSSRADLGAVQNRLGHAVSNLKVTSQNLTESESRIRDVDVAEESSRMTRDQVLSQAGVSVLAQANQMPQMALKLLG
jgi:flagellin